tara:strand:- start:18133 stop:18864 length:732 start_codon:yes stop_codon:yes gene_type:complete
MFKKNKTIFKISHILNDEIVLFPHLGIGDHIICNGIVNYLTNALNKVIFLPAKDNHLEQITFLYSRNPQVHVFEVKNETRNEDIENFAEKKNLQILKIGYKKVKKNSFNTYFYKQLGLPYEYTKTYFSLPQDIEKSSTLKNHLFEHFNVTNDDFILVHSESSYEEYDLTINSSLNKIYVNKETDIFGNMFLYEWLIKNAKEIHCINGSFLHLVERVSTKAKLFYHHKRKNNIYISDNWQWIKY